MAEQQFELVRRGTSPEEILSEVQPIVIGNGRTGVDLEKTRSFGKQQLDESGVEGYRAFSIEEFLAPLQIELFRFGKLVSRFCHFPVLNLTPG
jgi:hypothetical protein